MAIITPPLYLTVDAVYTAKDLGLPYRDIVSEGVIGSGDYAVSQRGAGANMSVDVALGAAWVAGDDNTTTQPVYRVRNDATVNIAVTAADPTNPRIDIVVLEVRDSTFSGVSNDARLRIIAGTPAGSPAVPSTPNNCIKLADISVLAAATSITTARITDKRGLAQLGGGLGAIREVTSLPANPYNGQIIKYVADATNGIAWMLQYRSASASTYKWEFIGGAPMYAEVQTSESRNNAVYGALATVGPSITVPLAGQYSVYTSAQVAPTGAGFGAASYTIGGTAADDLDSIVLSVAGAAGASVGRTRVKTLASAATALTMQYRSSVNTAFLYRQISVTPVRVG